MYLKSGAWEVLCKIDRASQNLQISNRHFLVNSMGYCNNGLSKLGVNMSEFTRRDFVQFLTGAGVMATKIAAITNLLPLSSCSSFKKVNKLPFTSLEPTSHDELVTVPGVDYNIMMTWGDIINDRGERFGFNNDYTMSVPFNGKSDESILWVNHEYLYPHLFHGRDVALDGPRTRKEVIAEMEALGGSLLKIKKEKDGLWKVDTRSKYNRRVHGRTPIPFAGANRKIAGKRTAIGTHGNCAGGITPWGNFLTCEEGYMVFFTDKLRDGTITEPAAFNWEQHFKHSHEHYGWVVEVEPLTGKAKKLVGLGRFAHECATCVKDKNGRTVVYSGDDSENQFIYKFIADKPDSLDHGELFVADIINGKWLSLDINKNEILKDRFKDQVEVLTYCREAAALLGATPCDRPEDIEVNPHNGDLLITLTNNKPKQNFHGSILKISELDDYSGMRFKAADFLVGGVKNKFACPDNLAFDHNGNLWLCSDISGSDMNKAKKPQYLPFKNNGLFYIPMSGDLAGTVHRVATAPVDAEFTGISFSPDGKSLFCSVQHPGEKSKSVKSLRSHWPNGGNALPRSAIVQFHGPVIDQLLGS